MVLHENSPLSTDTVDEIRKFWPIYIKEGDDTHHFTCSWVDPGLANPYICQRTFENRVVAENHLLNRHFSNITQSCACGRWFTTLRGTSRHYNHEAKKAEKAQEVVGDDEMQDMKEEEEEVGDEQTRDEEDELDHWFASQIPSAGKAMRQVEHSFTGEMNSIDKGNGEETDGYVWTDSDAESGINLRGSPTAPVHRNEVAQHPIPEHFYEVLTSRPTVGLVSCFHSCQYDAEAGTFVLYFCHPARPSSWFMWPVL